jgi:4-alpha-glucanotransferase
MVIQVMQELGLIGLRIQRMPSEPNCEFGIPSQYNYMTVCALFNNVTLSLL